MQRLFWVCALLASASAGCSIGEVEEPPPALPTVDQIPVAVVVAGGTVTLGLATEPRGASVAVDRFRITRSPVTQADYQACVLARGCDTPSSPAEPCRSTSSQFASSPERIRRPDAPELCASTAQATAYCAWVGGSIPTEPTWLLAARGPEPRAYPWGTTTPTCAQHPDGAGDCCATTACANDKWLVGQHIAGQSPSGVEDVLLSGRELIAPSAAGSGACATGCVVASVGAGSIDRFEGVRDDAVPERGAAFRCVWPETSR